MALFIVRHEHSAEICPAGDPQVAPMLAQLVSKAGAQPFGIEIHGEGVVTGGHTLYLILDAPDQQRVTDYMAPFGQMGSVEVLPAASCEQVVARAAC